MRVRVWMEFKIEDMWIGLYWKRTYWHTSALVERSSGYTCVCFRACRLCLTLKRPIKKESDEQKQTS